VKKFFALLMILLMVMVVAAGCKATGTEAETTAAAATAAEAAATALWTVTISGIGDKDISFTDADAAKMSTVEITATKKEVDQKWIGIPLKAILDFYGATDYSMVKAEASDGYSAELDKVTVDDAGTILGFSVDGQALSKDDGFVQIVVKSQSTKSWVKAVVKVTVVK
jgi:DMSO/TMAO reductase YedYZ molybdopterin-dependent catalytic subunit